MNNQGIGSWPARRARKTPRAVALVHDEGTLTYAQLHERVQRLAGALRGEGIAPGDRVVYLGPNAPSFVETFFAVAALGAVFVPVNTRLAPAEIDHVLGDSGAVAVVTDGQFCSTVDEIAAPNLTVRVAVEADRARPGWTSYDELVDRSSRGDVKVEVDTDAPCLIMYTSGTTGRAKGAVLTHANLTWNAVNLVIDAEFRSTDVALVVAPLFHAAALNNNFLPTMLVGGTAVLVRSFDPEHVLELIAAHRITYLHGVPAIYQALAAAPGWDGADLSSVRRASCGGAPVPLETIHTYLARNIRFSQGYGMTETGPSVLYLAPELAFDKIGAVGVPHFFADSRVVDAQGNDIAAGQRGEILVRGPAVTPGYWNNTQATEDAFDHGWFRSGDIATVDDDGVVTIVDRVKDMVISGGENIYPAEIEAVLRRHPQVADCAVIGMPHPKWGEVCRAIIEPIPGVTVDPDDILAFAQHHLGRFKVPKSVVTVDEFPRTATGKIVKGQLRHRFGTPELHANAQPSA